MIGQRLRQQRLARGLSLEKLAARMGGIVTKQALSKYEHGKMRPSPVVLNKLAATLSVKAAYLWSEPTIRVEFIAYRKGSGLPKKEQERIESLVRQTLEERVQLQELIGKIEDAAVPVQALPGETVEDAERAARDLREQWNLGLDSIASVMGVMESHCIHGLEIDARDRFDGISAVAYDEEQRVKAAAVVTRRGVAGERQRLNLTHELGHLVLRVPEDMDEKKEEKVAFRFGAAFLAPADTVRREIGSHRSRINLRELLLLKERFGMSIQALLYRLRDLGIITEVHYQQWCRNINRRGWRKQEPFELLPEQSMWMRQSVLHAVAERLVTKEMAERMLGEPVEMEQSLSLVERRAFMELSLEERRRILARQAEKMAKSYEPGSELMEWAEEFVDDDLAEDVP